MFALPSCQNNQTKKGGVYSEWRHSHSLTKPKLAVSNGRSWIRQASRLDDQVVEFVALFHQISDDANKIAPHGAANAAVVHFDNVNPRQHQ
jgi:hypothetical protein